MKKAFKDRLREPSTWAGIAALFASAAHAYATRDPSAIGAVIAGVVAIVTPEAK